MEIFAAIFAIVALLALLVVLWKVGKSELERNNAQKEMFIAYKEQSVALTARILNLPDDMELLK